MAGLRFTDLQARPTEFPDFTSLTLAEFQQLVPPFEAAFQAHMAAWQLDGTPRTARQFAVYSHCPLPTPEDRLVFILVVINRECSTPVFLSKQCLYSICYEAATRQPAFLV
jgi:hypothetical protein